MQTTPVTQAQYAAIMRNIQGADSDPSHFQGNNRPMETVSYSDALAFIAELNKQAAAAGISGTFRLPTKEEWEYAAQGDYAANLVQHAWFADNSNRQTHPVAKKLPNRLGLYDMLGNVWEWTSSLDAPGSENRVVRGGDWNFLAARPALRLHYDPVVRSGGLGFRLVRTP